MRRSPAIVLAAAVTVLAVTNPVVADAARLITGKQIKDGSVASVDIKDRSLLAKDFAAGQIPAGPAGEDGAAGASGVGEIVTWTFSHAGSGAVAEAVNIYSSRTLPAYAQIIGVTGDLDGDFSSCSTLEMAVRPDGTRTVVNLHSSTPKPNLDSAFTQTDVVPMRVSVTCNNQQGYRLPTPAFSGSVTFRVIDQGGAATAWE